MLIDVYQCLFRINYTILLNLKIFLLVLSFKTITLIFFMYYLYCYGWFWTKKTNPINKSKRKLNWDQDRVMTSQGRGVGSPLGPSPYWPWPRRSRLTPPRHLRWQRPRSQLGDRAWVKPLTQPSLGFSHGFRDWGA